MKEYNRDKKIWEEVDKNKSLKKSKLCKGNKPHDFFLTLPSYLKTIRNISVVEVEKYYKSEERVYKFIQQEHDKLKELGIIINTYSSTPLKHLECAKCGKKDYVK